MLDVLKTPRRFATRGWALMHTGFARIALVCTDDAGARIAAVAHEDRKLAPYPGAAVDVEYSRGGREEALAAETVTYRAFLKRSAAEWLARLSHPAALRETVEATKVDACAIATLREHALHDGNPALVALCRLALGAKREELDPHELRAILQAEALGAPTWTARAAWARCLAMAKQQGRA